MDHISVFNNGRPNASPRKRALYHLRKTSLAENMPKYFGFENEAISTFHVWVQLRHVPLDIWGSRVFEKICSKIGKPVHMDQLTTKRERVTYARCSVEIDLSKDLIHLASLQLPMKLSMSKLFSMKTFPDSTPQCRMIGHTKKSCKRPSTKEVKIAKAIGTNLEKDKELEVAGLEEGGK